MTDRIRKLPFNVFIFLGLFAAIALLFGSCYIPEARVDGGLEFDVRMAPGDGQTRVLAGLVIDSGFEEVIKDVTQLLAVLELDYSALPSLEDQIDDTATEYLVELAIGGTISFGGNPFFAVEVPYDDSDPANPTADFNIYGIPSGRDYFLYMGGFQDTDEVKQYFGLKDEDADFDGDLVPYSNLFYVSGTEISNVITVPFAVPGVTTPLVGGFTVNDNTLEVERSYTTNGPGWYYLTDWVSTATTASATIIAPARQPFSVETGKKTVVEVHLVEE